MTLTHEQKLRRNELAEELKEHSPGLDYMDCVRAAAKVVQGKPRRAKQPARAVSETTRQAVDRAITEALKGHAEQKPAARPVTEMSEGELGGLLAESSGAERAPAGGTAAAAAEPVTGLPDKPLHELDHESFTDFAGAALMTRAEATGRSKFNAGAGAPTPPFMRGL